MMRNGWWSAVLASSVALCTYIVAHPESVTAPHRAATVPGTLPALRPDPTEIDQVGRPVDEAPVRLWAWDDPGAGCHEIALAIARDAYPDTGVTFRVDGETDRTDMFGPREDDVFHASLRCWTGGELVEASWSSGGVSFVTIRQVGTP